MLQTAKRNWFTTIAIVLMVAFLYAFTGYFGLFFATPPGYATAIWIPSGIALGAALVWGLRTLPGVFFGSLLVNYIVTQHSGISSTSTFPITVGMVIATGATLQTFTGWWLIKKFLGLNNLLNYPNDILLFALLSGPVACLINTTWSNTALLLLQINPLSTYLLSWFTWWIGDSMGVLIFTPFFLILFASPRKIWCQRILSVMLPLGISFSGVVLVYCVVNYSGVVYVNQKFSWQLWSVLISGLFFCVYINIILLIVSGQKSIAHVSMRKKKVALKKEELKNALILRSAGEGIFGLDHEGYITFINPAAERMLGYSEGELNGKQMHNMVHHSYADGSKYPQERCPIYLTREINKISHITDEVFWRKDGSYFPIEYITTPLPGKNKEGGNVVIFNDISQRKETEIKLYKMAHYDILTGLPNRNSFLEYLTKQITNAEITQTMLAVCFIDVDNFKQINDILGHSVGDETLKVIAKLLKLVLGEAGYFARLGGDEFAVILEDAQSLDDIKNMLDRIILAVSKPIRILDLEINISMSIGVAAYPIAGTKPEEIIKNADIAMYHAKESGKNTYAFYDESINRKVKRRHMVDTELRRALANNEFKLEYQLQIDAHSLQPLGLEALLRWHNAELGDVRPEEFIPIAESNGLIHQIGYWVLNQACNDYKKLLTVYHKQLLILSINVSVVQLENIKFLQTIEQVLHNTEMKSKNLMFEITESALMRHPEHTMKVMKQIQKLGIPFALDDFGISYSSMQYLKVLPVSLIKIDKEFIRDIITNDNDAKIVNAIIQLSHGMGISTIAEGVETKEQFQLLKEMGCEYIQGFYFSKPVAIDVLLANPVLEHPLL